MKKEFDMCKKCSHIRKNHLYGLSYLVTINVVPKIINFIKKVRLQIDIILKKGYKSKF
jgi:hypothetical protein